MLKSAKGKLDVGDPRNWWAAALRQLVASPLDIRPEHVAELHSLPAIHQDPFDRILMAQAIAEQLVLLSADRTMARYRSDGLRILES